MHIAVCIQNNDILSRLHTLFDSYDTPNSINIHYRFFKSDIDLICDFLGGEYDALFLDVFDNISDLIAEIRQKDKLVRLILTAATAVDSTGNYGRDIWYCLPVPLSETFLFAVLDRLSSSIRNDTDTGIVLKSRKGISCLAFSTIEYVEVINKTVRFHQTDGTINEVTASLSEYEATLLHWPDFFRVHRAYIINLAHVQKLESGCILTSSGHSIPVSKHLFPQLKKACLCRLMDPQTAPENEPLIPSASVPVSDGTYSILFVDDEEEDRTRWAQILLNKGCRVQTADCGKAALALAKPGLFDCVILDVRLGSDSGFDFCRALQEKTDAPVIFLSIMADSENQTTGFLSGGIDYITKDTSPELFWLKIKTRIQMSHVETAELCDRSLRIDLKRRRVYYCHQEIALTTVEYDLLCLLMQNPGTVYTPTRLYSMIWGTSPLYQGQMVQLHLSQLQHKLENIQPQHVFIKTVWGKGYYFAPETET